MQKNTSGLLSQEPATSPTLLDHTILTARMHRSKDPLHLFVQSSLPLLVVLEQVSCEYADMNGAGKEALHALKTSCRQHIALLVHDAVHC